MWPAGVQGHPFGAWAYIAYIAYVPMEPVACAYIGYIACVALPTHTKGSRARIPSTPCLYTVGVGVGICTAQRVSYAVALHGYEKLGVA